MHNGNVSSSFKTQTFSKVLIVYLILISLLANFNLFKVIYNCQKKTKPLNVLISPCVQEVERLKIEKTKSARLIFTSKSKRKNPKKLEAANK